MNSSHLAFRLRLLDGLLVSPWMLPLILWLVFFWQLGGSPLYDLDEGAFTEATREMLASGNFITPHKNGQPRYDKPVMIYWLQAGSVALLGLNEFALRLPSAIAASLWLLALWLFVRQRLDTETATAAALVMALSLEIGLIGKAAVADAVLNLFIALAFFDVYRYRLARLADSPRARGLLWRVYLWLGLGFLTKGPVAVFFPLVVSLLYALTMGWREVKIWLGAVFEPRGWLVFLAVAAPWYLAIYLDNGLGFFQSFFLKHNLGRFGGVIHGHEGFPGYYLAMLPLVILPFSGWLLAVLPALRRIWVDPFDRFLLLWFLTVLLVFSFSSTKLPHYLVYGLTPLFILLARYRERLRNRWLALLPAVVLVLVLLALPLVLGPLAEQANRLHEIALFELGREVLDGFYVLGILSALALLIGLFLAHRVALWQRVVLAGVIQTLVVYGLLVPRVFEVMQAPVKEAALLARQLDAPTVVYHTSMPSFSVYRQAITPDRDPEPGDLVFLRIDKLERLRELYPPEQLETLYQRGAVALVRVGERPTATEVPDHG
ncbi:ArnT family glycosyltransferase [Thiorhodovibrio frisius]|uniref:PMT family glycosyltransferase, 4-amino-4-deoxy-L-arabinose transferase n=1 Tax=Thiorhodovibrio frisius TaxID=631362 RepID=H8Z8A5_9GAMM|nr:glycosyltransferase family 39 protein [Thiorhodovibrio frisius]EIC21054.1 PMT family glycosyltransferase, 4-amino-4-deoxy-L-arabinose transferase [Thiorhodovibrio frisius]WPL22114.1 Undecaprenyl phosphate-alpha-4-amino-4-deoxy-L-arabinose arabinosyl transferase [Thiorhodovibrio frisius]